MGWMKNMSLKNSFFTIIVSFLLLAIILSALFYSVCQMAIDYFELYVVVPVSPAEAVTPASPSYSVTFDAEAHADMQMYYYYRLEPAYSFLSFLQISVPVLLVVIALISADLVFYRLKLKHPISILRQSAERIQKQDLDFEITGYSSDELGRLCEAFEIMRKTLLVNNQELWRQAEERRRLNAAFSHDLRNPVTVLKGSAKMAKQCAVSGTGETKLLIENLTRIESYTGRIERYVEAMSNAGRLEQIQIEKSLTDLQTLLYEIENAMRLVAADSGKILSFGTLENTGSVLVDKNVLLQIAENLVSNALRFAEQTVLIRLFCLDDMLVLEVTDDGNGFPDGLLRNGIQPFQKGNEDAEHFGMGLYICDLLCKKQGGYLKIANNQSGASACAALKVL